MDKAVLITIDVSAPGKTGTRKVVVAGAPAGEMPVTLAGAFQDMHRLLDEMWVTLLRRAPQVVDKNLAAAQATGSPGDSEPAGDGDQADGEAQTGEDGDGVESGERELDPADGDE